MGVRHDAPSVSRSAKERALRRALADPATLPRFWANVAPEPTAEGCRLWIGRCIAETRPTFFAGGHSVQPKRVAWFAGTGTLAAGGSMTATCGNDRCVEVAHLAWRAPRWR
jgi:hypothetical protein